MALKFEDFQGVDLFQFKSYLKPPGKTDISGNITVVFNEIFVNFLMMILNLIVSFFSFLIKFLDEIDIAGYYEKSVYSVTKDIYDSLFAYDGGGYVVLSIAGVYLFWIYLTQNGRFIRKLFHILAVLSLGAAYFGTVDGQDAGLWAFDQIEKVSQDALSSLNNIEVTVYDPNSTSEDIENGYDEGDTIKFDSDISSNYVETTVFRAFLYLNTGNENGKYAKDTYLDLSEMLGEKNEEGKFISVTSDKRQKYIKDNAGIEKGKNKFQSLEIGYVFLRFFYLVGMIPYAVIKALPIVFIKSLVVIAEMMVLLLRFLVPLGAVLSFIPYFQNMLFNIFKKMMAGTFVPALGTFFLGLLFFVENVISKIVDKQAGAVLSQIEGVSSFRPVLSLWLLVVLTLGFYIFLWRNKGSIIGLFLGQDMAHSVSNAYDKYLPENPFKTASDVSHLALTGAGFGAGMVAGGIFNGIDKINQFRTNFTSDNSVNPEEYRRFSDAMEGDLYDSPVDDPGLVDDQLDYDNTIDGDFTILEEQKQLEYSGDEEEQVEVLPYQEEISNLSDETFKQVGENTPLVDVEKMSSEDNVSFEQADENIPHSKPIERNLDEEVGFEGNDYEKIQHEGFEGSVQNDSEGFDYQEANQTYSDSFDNQGDDKTSGFRKPEYGREPKMVKPVELLEGDDTESLDYVSGPEKTQTEENPYLTEAEQLSQAYRTRRQQKKMSRLEKEIKKYDAPDAMYKTSGSNAFTRGFRQSMGRDMRIKANIERRDRLMDQLEKLREGS